MVTAEKQRTLADPIAVHSLFITEAGHHENLLPHKQDDEARVSGSAALI
jgi:hypothetical protein